MKPRIEIIGPLAAATTLWLAASGCGDRAALVPAGVDAELCTRQLQTVYQAIQAYRQDHKDLPNWLSDLVPKYIANTNVLICPVTRRTGQTHTFEHLQDPTLPACYLYEFSPSPMGHVWAGGQIRMRDFKRRQMGFVGGEVPMVRCHLHKRVLNLAFSGHVYNSSLNWEDNFTNVVDRTTWSPEKLFTELTQALDEVQSGANPEAGAGTAPRPTLEIPLRPDNASPSMLDLTVCYHAALKETWHPGSEGNDLAGLPAGVQTLAGVPFDIRGIVQLNGGGMKANNGKPYPRQLRGIKLGRKCERLHFLHATGWSTQDGTVVGYYGLRYADGSDSRLPIVYGEDVRDWWVGSDKTVELKNAQVAWQGRTSNGSEVRVYLRTWENPHPDREVATVEFISAMSYCAPFLLAVTTVP